MDPSTPILDHPLDLLLYWLHPLTARSITPSVARPTASFVTWTHKWYDMHARTLPAGAAAMALLGGVPGSPSPHTVPLPIHACMHASMHAIHLRMHARTLPAGASAVPGLPSSMPPASPSAMPPSSPSVFGSSRLSASAKEFVVHRQTAGHRGCQECFERVRARGGGLLSGVVGL